MVERVHEIESVHLIETYVFLSKFQRGWEVDRSVHEQVVRRWLGIDFSYCVVGSQPSAITRAFGYLCTHPSNTLESLGNPHHVFYVRL